MMTENSKTFCAHSIVLSNLFDGDVINYSLLLIRGSVFPIHSNSNIIEVRVGNRTLQERICPNSGDFKLILDFISDWCATKPTTVAIKLKYCKTETETIHIQINNSSCRGLYRVKPLYILCCDEDENELVEHHCKIIDLNLRLIQALYADRIQKAGFSRTTFVLSHNKNESPKNWCCEVFRSDIKLKEALAANEQSLWNNLAEELLRKNRFQDGEGIKLKLIGFMGCTQYDGKKLHAHAALGGGDFALFSSAFFYAWPKEVEQIAECFLNKTAIDLAKEPDGSNNRKTYGGVYASTLGAVCHEIGHVFDLGHDDGIMGTGLDFVNRVVTLNSRTENLPKRIFADHRSSIAKLQSTSTRVTQFTKRNENFLENYRMQKENDGFYFTRNCALILAHHKWFNQKQCLEKRNNSSSITFNFESGLVLSKFDALKVIEIRSNFSSLVDQFYEIKDLNTFHFKLPIDAITPRQTTHHLFVMLINGTSKRLEFC